MSDSEHPGGPGAGEPPEPGAGEPSAGELGERAAPERPPPLSRRALAGLIVAAALAIAIPVVIALATSGGDGEARSQFPAGSVPERRIESFEAAVAESGCESRDFASEGETETLTPVDYASDPPHSGNHGPRETPDDAYLEAPATEALVHSLYHGRVIFWFRDLEDSQLGALKALYDEDPQGVLIAPRESMPYRIAATAWTHRLGCEEIGPATWDALRAFRDRWRFRGPEFVPPAL